MTAQGSRRLALVIALAVLALVAWRLWPRAGAADAGAGTDPGFASERSQNGRKPPRSGLDVVHPAAPDSGRFTAALAGGGRKRNLPVDCIGGDERRMRLMLESLQPERSAEDAFSHAILLRLLLDDDGGDPVARRHQLSRAQAQWQLARARWPSDVDIAWQAARNCDAEFACDEQAALAHLLELDRDNAAAWLLAMDKAWRGGQRTRYESALAQAAGSPRYAPPTGNVFRALQPVYAAVPPDMQCINPTALARRAAQLGHMPTPDDYANDTASLLELGFNAPDSGHALDGCRSSFGIPVPARRRSDCARVLSMLAGGETFGERETALPLLILLLGDSADGIAWREQYRRMLYLQSIVPRNGDEWMSAKQIMDRGAVEARRQAAIEQHRWPPPSDWMPRWEVQRALIVRGVAM